MKKIAIIDYQMSNMFSIKNALNKLGFNSEITSNYKTLFNSDGAILPGVGSFPEAIKKLKKLDLINPINDFIKENKPFMGICLGMQLLFDESEEFEFSSGLGIIKGKVKKLLTKKKTHPRGHKVCLENGTIGRMYYSDLKK